MRSIFCLAAGLAACLAASGMALRAARAGEPLTPREILAHTEARLQALDDYECVADVDTRVGDKTDPGSCRIWYKSPGLARFKATRGRMRGCEVVVDEKGKLYGRKGGLLKAFVSRLKPTDSRVRNLRGTPITELCWTSICRRLHERMGLPGARTDLSPRTDPGAPYEVTLTYPAGGRTMRERYRIDPSSWLPLEARLFEDAVEVERVEYREIKLNTGLAANWFRL